MSRFIRIWQQVHRRETGLKSLLLIAILGTKFPKEHFLVHKTTNLCTTQNTQCNQISKLLKLEKWLAVTSKCHMFELRRLSCDYHMSSNVFTNKGTNWSFPNEIKNLKATRFPVLNLHLKNNAKMIFMRIKKLEIISSLHFLIDRCHQSVKLLLHLYVKEDCVTKPTKMKRS